VRLDAGKKYSNGKWSLLPAFDRQYACFKNYAN